MLDVHPPHTSVHDWRDFLLHLMTITVGLLIALSLEGIVEWNHHRHLAHDAEINLHNEIAGNAKSMKDTVDDVHHQQQVLQRDVEVLKAILRNPKAKDQGSLEINFHIRGFDNVSWKTAQSTGALAYVPYTLAREYSDIYSTQDEVFGAERRAARDAIVSLGPLSNMGDGDQGPTPQVAASIIEKIQVLEGQLMLVDALDTSLKGAYDKFLATHPE